MSNQKLVSGLKLDLDGKRHNVVPMCNWWAIQLYTNFGNDWHRCFNFVWQWTKTNIVKKYSTTEAFTKIPISDWFLICLMICPKLTLPGRLVVSDATIYILLWRLFTYFLLFDLLVFGACFRSKPSKHHCRTTIVSLPDYSCQTVFPGLLFQYICMLCLLISLLHPACYIFHACSISAE